MTLVEFVDVASLLIVKTFRNIFATNISLLPVLTNVVHQKFAVPQKYPAMYGFDPLSIDIQYAISLLVPHHCVARSRWPVEESLAMKISRDQLLTSAVGQKLAVHAKSPAMYEFDQVSIVMLYATSILVPHHCVARSR